MSKPKSQPQLTPEKYIRTKARALPIGICYISGDWKESRAAVIIVARVHPNKNITHGVFFVDLYCLGVKDTLWLFNQNPLEFKAIIDRQNAADSDTFPVYKTNYALVHNIIYGAISYAEENGFRVHKNFELTQFILEEDDERIPLIDVEFGYKGKPLYIASPENPDELRRVNAHLGQRLGQGNFYIVNQEEAADFFKGKVESEKPPNNQIAISDNVNYYDSEVKRQIIKNFLDYEIKPLKVNDEPVKLAAEIAKNAEIIFYKYILSPDEIRQAADTVANILDFKITHETLSDEMLFANVPLEYQREEIRDQAAKIHKLAFENNIKQANKEVTAAMQKYPGVPIFQYYHLRLLQYNGSKKSFHNHVLTYLQKNPSYFPFGIMTAIDFMTYNPEKIHRKVSETINLKNYFPERTEFCREEVSLHIEILTMNYLFNRKFALLDKM